MGYRAVKAVLLVSAIAVGYCFFGGWIWTILSTTVRTTVYVASLVATYTWQVLNPQPATYSSLPELHQVLLNVTTDATRVADLLHEFLSQYQQDPQLRSKFITFLQQKANTSYTQVDQQLSWVLWLYSVLWMPLLVVTCLARASSSKSTATAAAEAADREDLTFETHARQHSSSIWGMPGGSPAAAGSAGPPRSSSLLSRDASGAQRHLDRSFTGVPHSRRSSISSSRQPSSASQLHQEDQDALYQSGQPQDIPRTKRYGRSRTISSWSSGGYDDGLLATASLDRQSKAALLRTASIRSQGPGSAVGSDGMGRHTHPPVSGASLDQVPLAGLAAAAPAGDNRSSSDWATAYRRATSNGSLDGRSFRAAPVAGSWSEGGSYTGVSRKPASSGSKAAGQLGPAAAGAGGDVLTRLGSTADTQLRSSDQLP